MDDYEFDRCGQCGRFGFLRRHKCPPRWLVWYDYSEREYAKWVYADDAEDAARSFVERDEASMSEYTSFNSEVIVYVVPESESDKKPEKYTVTSEAVPQYRARKIAE